MVAELTVAVPLILFIKFINNSVESILTDLLLTSVKFNLFAFLSILLISDIFNLVTSRVTELLSVSVIFMVTILFAAPSLGFTKFLFKK